MSRMTVGCHERLRVSDRRVFAVICFLATKENLRRLRSGSIQPAIQSGFLWKLFSTYLHIVRGQTLVGESHYTFIDGVSWNDVQQ